MRWRFIESMSRVRFDARLAGSYLRAMDTTHLSSKGQVILPKAVREAHGRAPGTAFTVEDVEDGVLLRPLKSVPPTRLDDVAGCLPVSGPARSAEEMDAAIVDELIARRDRGRY